MQAEDSQAGAVAASSFTAAAKSFPASAMQVTIKIFGPLQVKHSIIPNGFAAVRLQVVDPMNGALSHHVSPKPLG